VSASLASLCLCKSIDHGGGGRVREGGCCVRNVRSRCPECPVVSGMSGRKLDTRERGTVRSVRFSVPGTVRSRVRYCPVYMSDGVRNGCPECPETVRECPDNCPKCPVRAQAPRRVRLSNQLQPQSECDPVKVERIHCAIAPQGPNEGAIQRVFVSRPKHIVHIDVHCIFLGPLLFFWCRVALYRMVHSATVC